jgi:hypothetical protein
MTWLNQYIDETIPAFGHESHDFQISRSCWSRAVLYSSVEGEVDKRTFHFGFSIDCVTPVHFYEGRIHWLIRLKDFQKSFIGA